MTTTETRTRYRQLETLRDRRARELRDGLRVLRDPAEGPVEVKDPEEQGLRQSERDLDVAVLRLKGQTCRDIEDALVYMRTGKFGGCEACGEPIPPARL